MHSASAPCSSAPACTPCSVERTLGRRGPRCVYHLRFHAFCGARCMDIQMYHEGSRELQDRFGSRQLADRLVEVLARTAFTEDDRKFIESRPLFFLATADAEGRPDCSYKGGPPGFVRVAAPDLLVFPDYDGNGMFKSLGNIRANPHVGLLFLSMGEAPKRLRVNGRAEVVDDDPLMA